MNLETDEALAPQRRILDRWLSSLRQLPAVELVWLTGSLAAADAAPGADIDMRFAVADTEYDHLWKGDKAPLLEGLGEYLVLLDRGFVILQTAEGITIDLWADKSSEAARIQAYEWKVLLNRLPSGQPIFDKLPERSAAETWPAPPPMPDDVRQQARMVFLWMSYVPSLFHRGEIVSAAGHLAFMREALDRVMYQRLGIQYPKRSRHLNDIWPQEFLDDFAATYQRSASALDVAALAAAYGRLFDILERHFQALSEQVGGGLEQAWYRRLSAQIKQELVPFARHVATAE
jgi:hypothetical protein